MANQILFIDIDKDYSNVLRSFLDKYSAELTISSNIQDAIDKLATESWGIILLNALVFKELSPHILEAKQKDPKIQLIIYASKELLDQALDDHSFQMFACLETPVNKRLLTLALDQAQQMVELKKSNEYYAQQLFEINAKKDLCDQLFDEIPCYISVQDRDLKIIKVNKRFKHHFGEKIGKYCYDVYKNKTSQCLECPVVKTFSDGRSHRTEETVISESGRQYNVLTQTAPLKDEKGRITSVMELSVNITKIRQLQDHLASLGLMLGSMFHGLKGTLTALDGGVYQLETGLAQNDNEKVLAAYDQIKTMVDKIRKMVVEILDYAKSRELKYEQVDIGDFVQTVVDTSRPMAEKALVDLKIDVVKNPGSMEVDEGWLEAALVNFLQNSVEACVADAGKKKSYSVLFSITRPSRNQICFSISDNGVGMDQETKDKLFTLFFTSKGPKGTGLGMFIAHRVIQYHGGRVEFESKSGQGTSFSIYLPCHKTGSTPKVNLGKNIQI